MKSYEAIEFNIPSIKGISDKQIELHIGLYKGYVTNLNALYEALGKTDNPKTNIEARRRLNFELAGIKNHECYFGNIIGEPSNLPEGKLKNLITTQFGSFENYIAEIKHIANTTRGVGWVMSVYEKNSDCIHNIWITDHELGGVVLPPIFALDMWEHSYMVDYLPSEKASYIDAYVNAINWKEVSSNFDELS